MKSILDELEGLEIPGAGRRIFGWGLTGVVVGLGLAAVALVIESYFAAPERGDAGAERERDAGGGKRDAATHRTDRRAPAKSAPAAKAARKSPRSARSDTGFEDYLSDLDGPLRELTIALDAALLGLGDDTERAVLRRYVAYKKAGANYACAAARRTADEILVYLRLDPTTEDLLPFMRDVTDVGHIGTGDLELRLASAADLEAARPYMQRSYEAA